MEKFQAVIYGIVLDEDNKPVIDTKSIALLPFSVIATDVKGKAIKDENGNEQFISRANYFANMLKYQLAELDAEKLVQYDYLFSTISVSGRKYGRINQFGYIDEGNGIVNIGNFGNDENGQPMTARTIFPKSASIVKHAEKATGKAFDKLNAKERREFCRNVANDVVTRCNFTNDVLTNWANINK